MYENPHTYITQVSLWNDYGENVAVARLSKPFRKNFARDVFIKVKLSY